MRKRSVRPRAPRRVLFFVFDDFQLLDLAGPLEVFAGANLWAQNEASPPRPTSPYESRVVSASPESAAGGARVASSAGLEIVAEQGLPAVAEVHTVILVGGPGMPHAARDRSLLSWLRDAHGSGCRVASVCNGAFLLAEAGLLDGRRAATHWALCQKLQERYPKARVLPDSLFARDGNVWTSAGVSSGMDLALALVEEDLGRRAALTISRWMVLFLKRPGGQSQFSAQLANQLAERQPLREVQEWMIDHLEGDLSVPTLAGHARMSPRHFARVFREQVGAPPGRYVLGLRIEAARQLLEDTSLGVQTVARRCGLGSEETLRRTFVQHMGVTPSAYRQRFRADKIEAAP